MNRLVLSAVLIIATAIFAAPYLQAKIDSPDRKPAETAATTTNSSVQEPAAAPERHGRVRVRADQSGHFLMTAVVKGRRIEVMADTGASTLALRHEDAVRLGLRPQRSDYTVRVRTANGISHAAPVTLREVRIGSVRVRNVRALVAMPDAMSVNLLGMSFLGQLSHFTMRGDELVMVQ